MRPWFMPNTMRLAACVMAALPLSALLAQQQNTVTVAPTPFYQYEQDAKPPASTPALQLPLVIHACGGGCSTGKGAPLILENGKYFDRTSGTGGVYNITKFTREAVVINHTDRPYPNGAVITGRLSPEGDSIVDGKITWNSPNSPRPFQMAWGDAVETVPGDHNGKPPLPACDAQTTATAADALHYGDQALSAKRMKRAVCWLRIASAQGDPMAEGALSLIFLKGLDNTPVDLPEAVRLARKSADAHNYLGENCLSLMYEKGEGMEKDPAKAALWKRIADTDEAAQKQAERLVAQRQASSQQQQMQNQVQGGLFLLNLFGSFDSGSSGSVKVFIDQNRVNHEACASGIQGSCH